MFKLFSEPLPPARPELAHAPYYSSCGCVYGQSRCSRAASPEPSSTTTNTGSTSSETDTAPLPPKQSIMPALTNARNLVLAEAHENRRRMDQCRAWASIVAGAARDAVHFNVEDSGEPYAGPRNLPSFYYDPESHEPVALQSAVHACPTSPVSVKREIVHDSDVKQETGAAPTPAPYRYVREEVLDEKPRRLDVQPLLEASALRRRRRDRLAAPSARAQAHPYVRVKTEETETPSVRVGETASTSAPTSSHHSTAQGSATSGRVHTVGDRQREPSVSHSRESSPAQTPAHEPTDSAPPSPSPSAVEGPSLAASHAPSPLPPTSHTPPAVATTPTRGVRDRESPQAPDQDSPQRICDPLPSIGSLGRCAREPSSSSSSGWKPMAKQRI